MTDRRIVILSDLHLGRPHCAAVSAEALRPLWKGAAHMILNGDIAEVHNRKHWSVAARQTLHLLDLCETDDVGMTLLSGNHDPFISDIRHLSLHGGRVFVTHGDVLHPAVAPWSPAAGRIRQAHAQAISALAPEKRTHLESILSASQFASHTEWGELEKEASHSTIPGMFLRPWAIAQVLHYWWIFPRLAARFAAQHAPRARFVILGHTHHPGIWRIGDRTIINTGSFGFPGKPTAVIIDESSLSVLRILRKGNEYRFHPKPIARYDLPAAADHAAMGNSDHDTSTGSPPKPLSAVTGPAGMPASAPRR
ncbi:MAG: metallophosphoesterase family protein [Phycisphaerales bacterium]|nr:MAG: metallophosphoesterase family protein [Phycisphaerales bacterium]